MSRASVKRDLEYMRSRFNAPIEYDREANGYRFGKPRSGPRYELPGLWFNAAEAHALLTMLQLLAEPAARPARAATSRRCRAPARDPRHRRASLEGHREAHPHLPARAARRATAAHFGVVAAALLKRRACGSATTTARTTARPSARSRRSAWCTTATTGTSTRYCHLRDDLRSFAVDAIREARAARHAREGNPGRASSTSTSAAATASSPARDVQWATLRFTPEAARWVSAQNWHPKQRVARREGRQLRARASVRRRPRAGDGDPEVRRGRRSPRTGRTARQNHSSSLGRKRALSLVDREPNTGLLRR